MLDIRKAFHFCNSMVKIIFSPNLSIQFDKFKTYVSFSTILPSTHNLWSFPTNTFWLKLITIKASYELSLHTHSHYQPTQKGWIWWWFWFLEGFIWATIESRLTTFKRSGAAWSPSRSSLDTTTLLLAKI